jgi:crotonobetainyl-CoA:carnitine CoA-transferase CaiB-like acyl-CoA transferase
MIPDLSSLRVLEIGTAVSVPLMGAVLTNLGADVIKIESRRKLDGNRVRVRKGGATTVDDSFPLWHEFNGGKRSVLLNLKSKVGLELFTKLIRQSDLFIQNFAPGWLERVGLGAQKLLELNPRLIMVFASGYGQQGPKSQQRVYASVMTALGGQEALIGEESGEVMGGMPIAFGDFNSTYHGLTSLFSALIQRERTGRGCMIDLSQIEAVTATLSEAFVEYQITGLLPKPAGNRSAHRMPHGIFPCSGEDRWLTLSIGTDAEWARLVELIRQSDADIGGALADPAWQQHSGRQRDRDAVEQLLSRWTRKFDRDELPARLQAAGLYSSPVLESDEMELDEHYRARQFVRDVNHPRLGAIPVTSTPWMFDGQTRSARASGPALGEHTAEVLCELCGLDPQQVEQLTKEEHLA